MSCGDSGLYVEGLTCRPSSENGTDSIGSPNSTETNIPTSIQSYDPSLRCWNRQSRCDCCFDVVRRVFVRAKTMYGAGWYRILPLQ